MCAVLFLSRNAETITLCLVIVSGRTASHVPQDNTTRSTWFGGVGLVYRRSLGRDRRLRYILQPPIVK